MITLRWDLIVIDDLCLTPLLTGSRHCGEEQEVGGPDQEGEQSEEQEPSLHPAWGGDIRHSESASGSQLHTSGKKLSTLWFKNQ